MSWTYDGVEFTEANEDHIGFVYCITELSTGKKYIGKKLLWKTVRLKPLKGTKRIRKVKRSSDWQKYYGSSKALEEAIAKNGHENYHREIIRFCTTKGELSYYELKEQIDRKVLFREDYYNEFIGVKIHSKHLGACDETI